MTDDALTDWPDKHRTYWTALAQTTGASEQHARFAYALATGMTQSAAARFAGYRGDNRTAGYAAARTRAVSTLLALAEGDGWESPSNLVTEEEKTKLLNQLMRTQDPNVRLKAIEQSDKRREREFERQRQREEENKNASPAAFLNEIAEIVPIVAIMLAERHETNDWKPKAVTLAAALAQVDELKKMVSKFADSAA